VEENESNRSVLPALTATNQQEVSGDRKENTGHGNESISLDPSPQILTEVMASTDSDDDKDDPIFLLLLESIHKSYEKDAKKVNGIVKNVKKLDENDEKKIDEEDNDDDDDDDDGDDDEFRSYWQILQSGHVYEDELDRPMKDTMYIEAEENVDRDNGEYYPEVKVLPKEKKMQGKIYDTTSDDEAIYTRRNAEAMRDFANSLAPGDYGNEKVALLIYLNIFLR